MITTDEMTGDIQENADGEKEIFLGRDTDEYGDFVLMFHIERDELVKYYL